MKVASVPQIEGLSVEHFLEHAKTSPVFLKHLPDEQDWLHLEKKWICDVLYTLDQPGVQTLIDGSMQARKQKMEEKQDLLIEMRPEFADALDNCINFSSKLSHSSSSL